MFVFPRAYRVALMPALLVPPEFSTGMNIQRKFQIELGVFFAPCRPIYHATLTTELGYPNVSYVMGAFVCGFKSAFGRIFPTEH